MKKAMIWIFALFFIPLAFADTGNDILHNSTCTWNPHNLSLCNNTKSIIGTDLYGIITGNPIFSATGGLTKSGYVEFDGNDYIYFGSDEAILHHRTNDQNWSALCTISTTGITTSAEMAVIFGTIPSKGDGDNGGWGIFIDDRPGTDTVGCALSIGNGFNLLTQGAITLVNDGKNHSLACVWNKTGAPGHSGTFWLDGVKQANNTVAYAPNKAPFNLTIGSDSAGISAAFGRQNYTGKISECKYVNRSLTGAEIVHEYNQTWNGTINQETGTTVGSDTTPPEITYYNLSSSDDGCESWNTNKNTACSTSDPTPVVQFNTSENAWCAIRGNSSATSGQNYTEMGSSRNCTGVASGEGTREHFCTLTNQDELVYDTSYIHISCKDASNNQNRSGTSTSGALKVSVTSLETDGRNSIGIGIQNALLSGYTNYTDLQIYARNLSNGQVKGTFDRAAKKGSKMWAFNRIGVSDSHVNMFNLTPVLYTFEFANKTSSNITLEVEKLINATK